MSAEDRAGGEAKRMQASEDSRGSGTGWPTWLAAFSMMLCVLGLALMSLAPALAAETQAPVRAHDYKMAGDASRVRLVLHFDREPLPRWFMLRAPHRLVIDLPRTHLTIDPSEVAPRGLVTEVRYGQVEDDASRLILSTDGPFVVEGLDIVPNESSSGFRMVADLVAASEAQFEAALADQMQTTGSTLSTPKGDRVVKSGAAYTPKPFTIVIDPGHGGIDSGAEGVNGTVEKAITLAFGLELKKKLEESGRFVVKMTRERDVFLRLDERVRIARQQEADLFISVHADTIKYRNIRGATVYTVSDRASDAESAALAARENLVDELAGMAVDDTNHEVSDILVDLIRRETHSFSIRFARTLLGELSDRVEMIKNPHRFAGFKVLKAPDVPSVLLELGYLSNPEDEEQLRNAEWRAKAIGSVVSAVELFAGARVGTGG
jgi:N-acetylmuramoyl-L-alanine amidase